MSNIVVTEDDIQELLTMLRPIASATHNTLCDRCGDDKIANVFSAAVVLGACMRLFNELKCCTGHALSASTLVQQISMSDPNDPATLESAKVIIDQWLQNNLGNAPD